MSVVLCRGLPLVEVGHLNSTHALLFPLLLLGKLELFVTCAPELGELLLLLLLLVLFFRLALDLELAATLDRQFHFHLAAFRLLEQAISLVFGLRHLLIKHFLLVVANGSQIFDLSVDHCLPLALFVGEALRLPLMLH